MSEPLILTPIMASTCIGTEEVKKRIGACRSIFIMGKQIPASENMSGNWE
jgi:hypothetical protein